MGFSFKRVKEGAKKKKSGAGTDKAKNIIFDLSSKWDGKENCSLLQVAYNYTVYFTVDIEIALLNSNHIVIMFSLITKLTYADREKIRKEIKYKEKH